MIRRKFGSYTYAFRGRGIGIYEPSCTTGKGITT
ncbi:hypothetical protein ACP4OV_031541 [Aristida adscensionis]